MQNYFTTLKHEKEQKNNEKERGKKAEKRELLTGERREEITWNKTSNSGSIGEKTNIEEEGEMM